MKAIVDHSSANGIAVDHLGLGKNKKKRHIRKRGSIRGRFFKLLASHKLPKDDASQHNDLPKRDFSRVFSSAGEVTGGFLPIDTYQNTRHHR